MNPIHCCAAMLLALTCIAAMAQDANAPTRIRGAITAFDGQVIAIHDRDGKDVNVALNDKTRISLQYTIPLGDIKPDSYVGVTAVGRGADGALYAREVHLIPESSRGAGEGHYAWDLEPDSTMTNGNVDALVNRNDSKELVVSYKGGEQKIIIPPDAKVVTNASGDKSLLKAGVRVFIIARPDADGKLTAQYVAVGKDGLKPPM